MLQFLKYELTNLGLQKFLQVGKAFYPVPFLSFFPAVLSRVFLSYATSKNNFLLYDVPLLRSVIIISIQVLRGKAPTGK